MFNSLTGKITAKLPQTVYLQVGGIEWDIAVPDTAIDELPPVGDEARIFTYLVHREDAMKLFGFASMQERAMFLDLLRVEGLGPKAALKVLSSVTCKKLSALLAAGDAGLLEKIPGVGHKTAQKMMLTLKGKLTLLDEDGAVIQVVRTKAQSPWADVINGLVDMGYDRTKCEQIVERVASEIKDPDHKMSQALKEDKIFRTALVELAR
ncbi:MAG: Holliday junction branch migration protein RuvA [Treponema sp.]|nr:Holliday junction branch migration protein RuvA [Candidatus Treponema caballi]